MVYLDLLRLLAAFGVVLLHVSDSGITGHTPQWQWNWCVSICWTTLVQWVVPLFVMISGALYLPPERRVSTKGVWTKSLPRLAVAWVFWVLVYLSIAEVRAWRSTGSLFYDVSMMFYFHLWFLPMLMGVYVVVPLLRHIAADSRKLLYALGVWLGCIAVAFFTHKWNIPQVSGLFRMGTVAVYSGWFMLGYFASRVSLPRTARRVLYVLGIAALVVSAAGTMTLSVRRGFLSSRYLETGTPHVVVMAFALFVFVRHNAWRLKPWMLKWLELVRKNLFGVYLCHALFLGYFTQPRFMHLASPLVTVPVASLVIFILSLCLTRLIRCEPLLRRVVE